MSWQKRARIALAVVGLGSAAAIYLMLGKRLPPPVPVAAAPGDPQATNETGPGNLTWLKANGDEDFHIQFQASSSYADGRSRFVKAHFVTAQGSEPLELWSDVAVAKKRVGAGDGPGSVDLTGHVVVETKTGWHIETDAATYDEQANVLRMPGAVTFTHDLLAGTSLGAAYDRNRQVIALLADPHVTMKPDAAGAGALDATALRITIDRTAKYALLDQQARIARDNEVLSADVATLRLTDDEKFVRAIELRAHASVVPKPGATGAPPEMHADDIDLGMRPDGQTLERGTLRRRASLTVAGDSGSQRIEGELVNFRLGPDGQTLSELDATENVALRLPPTADTGARTVTAQALTSTGDDKAGLTALQFDGASAVVTFTEVQAAAGSTPASTRTGVSKLLTLKLNGDIGSIDSAEFRREVKFTKDADVTATADRAMYYEPKTDQPARLWLYQDGGRALPRVVNQDLTIEGELVKLDVESNDIDATGTNQPVQSVKKPASGPGAPAPKPSLFASDQPMIGYGATATYVSKSGVMTYTSSAKVRAKVQQADGNNRVQADQVTVNTQTNDLSGAGKVDSKFLTDPQPATGGSAGASPGAPQPYTVRAATMKYNDASHVAHYTGTAADRAEVESQNGLTKARSIDLFLDEDGRTVKRMVADGEVYTLSGTREATGDHLIWTAATGAAPDSYVITGRPVYVKEPKQPKPEAGKPDCNWSLYTDVTFSAGGNMTGHAFGQTYQFDRACSVPLPRKGGAAGGGG